MPQYQRRLYEPSDEPRAFDGGEDGFQDDEGSRLPLLIVIALVVLASFAGVVWVAYTQGVQRGREDAPRILAARSQPKGAVERSDPYAKLDIYKAPKPDADAPSPSNTAVQPERAAHPPAGDAATADTTPSAAESTPAAAPEPRAENAAQQKPRPVIRGEAHPSTAPHPAAKPLLAPTASRTQPSANAPRPLAPQATLPAPAAVPPKVAPASAPQAAPPAATSSAASAGQGGYVLQIGSYTSEAEANASWQTYKQSHASVAGFAPDIKSADLGKRGTWYRLRVGPFSSLAEASAACAKLKAQGASCLPAKR